MSRFWLSLIFARVALGFVEIKAQEVTVAPFDEMARQVVVCERVIEFARIVEHGKVEKKRDFHALFSGCTAHDVPFGIYRVRFQTRIVI